MIIRGFADGEYCGRSVPLHNGSRSLIMSQIRSCAFIHFQPGSESYPIRELHAVDDRSFSSSSLACAACRRARLAGVGLTAVPIKEQGPTCRRRISLRDRASARSASFVQRRAGLERFHRVCRRSSGRRPGDSAGDSEDWIEDRPGAALPVLSDSVRSVPTAKTEPHSSRDVGSPRDPILRTASVDSDVEDFAALDAT